MYHISKKMILDMRYILDCLNEIKNLFKRVIKKKYFCNNNKYLECGVYARNSNN